MVSMTTDLKVAHSFWPVKSSEPSSFGTPPDSMRHHKVSLSRKGNMIVTYSRDRCRPYDVSSDRRVLTKGMLNKHFDKVRRCLRDVIKLPAGEFEAILVLLRFWAYYGQVYPKAEQVCSEAGCSKATFWRAVMHLKGLGLIKTIPRFRLDPHAKISSLYKLDKLLIVIARYLAEHGQRFYEKWLQPALTMPGHLFWSQIFLTPVVRAGPGP